MFDYHYVEDQNWDTKEPICGHKGFFRGFFGSYTTGWDSVTCPRCILMLILRKLGEGKEKVKVKK